MLELIKHKLKDQVRTLFPFSIFIYQSQLR